MSSFGYVLKQLRKKHKLTQTQLAKNVGLSFSAISMYERGEREPDFETIERFADYFNVDFNYIMGKSQFTTAIVQCDICGMRYEATSLSEVEHHNNNHTAFLLAQKHYGESFVLNPNKEFSIRNDAFYIINNADKFKEHELKQAFYDFCRAHLSKSIRVNSYNLNHPEINEYVAMLLNQPHITGHILKKFPQKVISGLIDFYGKLPGIPNGTTIYGIPNFDDYALPSPTTTEDYTTFPVIGEVAAGYDMPALENWEGDTVDIPNSYLKGRALSDFFVLKVKGDSMYPMYQDGDKVLILRQTTLNHSGQVGVVIYNDDYATLKKVEYVYGEDWMKLIPINPAVPPTLIEGESLEHCQILGIPKLLIREIEE